MGKKLREQKSYWNALMTWKKMEGNYMERKMIKSQMNHLLTKKWAYVVSVSESHLFLKRPPVFIRLTGHRMKLLKYKHSSWNLSLPQHDFLFSVQCWDCCAMKLQVPNQQCQTMAFLILPCFQRTLRLYSCIFSLMSFTPTGQCPLIFFREEVVSFYYVFCKLQ